ncbi:MAG: nucleoside deaminase [Myxococcales bacterium]|nr:nucleoside deaminase [Myxococcales bacterium]
MDLALDLAASAANEGEIPVGAVVVLDSIVIGRGQDARERTQDPTAHAEVLALREASARMGSWRLPGSTLYVTLEPCVLCVGAMLAARVDRVVYGAASPKSGAIESLVMLAELPGYNHALRVRSGVRSDEAGVLLQAFFDKLRTRSKSR